MEKYKKERKQYKNMKVSMILVLSLIFIATLVIAISNGIPKNVSINYNTSEILNSINNETIMRDNITCDEEECSQKMWKGDYNLGEVSTDRYICDEYLEINDTTSECISWKELKSDKLIEEITKLQAKSLEEIAKTITKRQEKEQARIVIEDFGQIIVEVTP